MSAAGIQNRAYGQPGERGIVTHVEQDAVQMFSEFHWLKHTCRDRGKDSLLIEKKLLNRLQSLFATSPGLYLFIYSFI